MELNLKNKVAFVAGSSRGIGLAVANVFLEEGAKVVITGRNLEFLKKAEQLFLNKFGDDQVLSINGNMNCAQDASKAIEKTLDKFGSIDSIVVNMGSGVGTLGWDIGEEDWLSMIHNNLLGIMTFGRIAIKHLQKKKETTLTFISSIVANETVNAPLAYSAAKAGLNNVVKNLSHLVGKNGIRVNAVAPGNILFPGGRWEQKLKERPDYYDQYIQNEIPLKRFGTPEDIANTVVFLASSKASFITGTCLVVDGGQTRSI